MKIDFENVRDAYRPGVQAISKGSGSISAPSAARHSMKNSSSRLQG